MLVKRYTYVISSLAKKFAELHYYTPTPALPASGVRTLANPEE